MRHVFPPSPGPRRETRTAGMRTTQKCTGDTDSGLDRRHPNGTVDRTRIRSRLDGAAVGETPVVGRDDDEKHITQ